jgi:putative colanic acid biosynthesis acetyltransferase WcaF
MSQTLPPPLRRSAWSARQRAIRLLWTLLGVPLWRLTPPLRAPLIRVFGGRVGRRCRLAASVQVAIPWNLSIGDDVEIGPRVILYSLGPISLGDGVVIDYRAHLCAGTHDLTDSRFPLLRPPIEIGAGTFIGIDAYVGPDVTLGRGCRVWPRASVYRSFQSGVELRGNPARVVTGQEPSET